VPNHRKDITGIRVGRLTVVSRLGQISGRAVWRCKCDCGEFVIVKSVYLTSRRTNSCGCWKRELAIGNLKRLLERKNSERALSITTVEATGHLRSE